MTTFKPFIRSHLDYDDNMCTVELLTNRPTKFLKLFNIALQLE